MSTTLYYEPVIPQKRKSLGDQLKYIIARSYWDHDGSLHGEDTYLTDTDIKYLCGIKDGSTDVEVIKDCNVLIEAIQKYGSVKIWSES